MGEGTEGKRETHTHTHTHTHTSHTSQEQKGDERGLWEGRGGRRNRHFILEDPRKKSSRKRRMGDPCHNGQNPAWHPKGVPQLTHTPFVYRPQTSQSIFHPPCLFSHPAIPHRTYIRSEPRREGNRHKWGRRTEKEKAERKKKRKKERKNRESSVYFQSSPQTLMRTRSTLHLTGAAHTSLEPRTHSSLSASKTATWQ